MNRKRSNRAAARGKKLAAPLLASALALTGVAAHGQAIERNPAPVPPAPAPHLPGAPAADANADATPLGMALNSLTIGSGNSLVLAAAGTVAVSGARNPAKLEARLRPYLGKPLSLRLIAEIRSEIARAWRAEGHPFVHVTAPEQDLAAGRLELHVEEFRLGAAKVGGTEADEAARIAKAIRQQTGNEIALQPLIEDLDWLNRYPFRRIEAIFAAGATPGETAVTWSASENKRWNVGGGYSNSGSPETGMNRAFVNVLAGLPGSDAWASYQLTTSGQRLVDIGNPPSGAHRYVSHAAHLSVPLAPRTSLELDFGDISSAQPVQAFDVRSHTQEWSLVARTALSNFSAGLAGEVYAGFGWKRQRSRVLFGTTQISSNPYDVGTITLGYAWRHYDSAGETAIDLALHVSPGGLSGLNNDAAFAAASNNTFTKARFAYATGALSRNTVFKGFTLRNTLAWQYAGTSLPLTEQAGLGGRGQVRAYTLDDGAFDRQVVLRNELRRDPCKLDAGGAAMLYVPWIYIDAGYGGQAGGKASHAIGAAGAGVDLAVGRNFRVSADGGIAMAAQGNTKAGDLRGNVKVELWF